MKTHRSPIGAQRYAMLTVFLLAPMGLGAKGCDHAVVGDDGQCIKDCTPGDAGADSGGTGSSTGGTGGTGTSGTAGKGTSTGGTSTNSGGTGTSTGGTGTSGTTSTGGTGTSGTGTSGTTSTGGTGTGGSNATCGGIQGLACGKGEYCNFPLAAQCGAADQTGTCRVLPDNCVTIDEPVCGCDDKTYSNACIAALEGVSVAKTGACEPDGTVCGGLRGAQCAEDEYCDFPPDAICGRADATGYCAAKPEACDAILDPVCGCDGETYSSDCEAAMAGVSVESDGECKDPGAACADNKGCEDGEFCNDPHCGTADELGACEAEPEACTKEYAPVCGCDGVTYGNECDAHAHGVSVASKGECGGQVPDFCGGIAGIGCPDKMFCDFPVETRCGSGDMAGSCRTMPDGCTEQYAPVCGCDGETYGNDCEAARAGVSVQAEGECEK